MFEVVDKRWRIYRRVGPTRHGMVDFPTTRGGEDRRGDEAGGAPAAPRASVAQLTRSALLERFTPPSVTV